MTENTKTIYQRAGMDNQMGYGDQPALLVVDLQTGFTDAENPLGGDLTDVINAANQLIDAAHKGEVPVIFTRVVTKREDASDLGVWVEKIPSLSTLQEGKKWVNIDSRLNIKPADYVIDKRQASAYHETELESILTTLRVDTAVVTGCTTSGCIRATAVDACSQGYYTIVPEEAVGDRAVKPHEANLFDISAKYGDLRPVDEVVDYLAAGGKNKPNHA